MIPTTWQRVTIGSVANVNPRLPRTPLPDEEVSFVSMSDLGVGTITNRQTRLANVVLNGFTQFTDGDILIAKITPCFENGKGRAEATSTWICPNVSDRFASSFRTDSNSFCAFHLGSRHSATHRTNRRQGPIQARVDAATVDQKVAVSRNSVRLALSPTVRCN